MVNTSDRIEYVRFEKSYEDEVLNVFIKSFVKYPLFWEVFEDRFNSEIKLRSFYEHLMKGIFRATIRKDDCYIGIIDGKVTSIVIVEKPSDKPVGFWDYAVSGMAGIIARIGIKDTLEFKEDNKTSRELTGTCGYVLYKTPQSRSCERINFNYNKFYNNSNLDGGNSDDNEDSENNQVNQNNNNKGID